MKEEFYRYAVTNGIYEVIDGADNIKEAREIVKGYVAFDNEMGIYTTDDHYHIFEMNVYTGEIIKEV